MKVAIVKVHLICLQLGLLVACASERTTQHAKRELSTPYVKYLVILPNGQPSSIDWEVPYRPGLTLADMALLSEEYGGTWDDVRSLRVFSPVARTIKYDFDRPPTPEEQRSVKIGPEDAVLALSALCSPFPRTQETVYVGQPGLPAPFVYWKPGMTVRDAIGQGGALEARCLLLLRAVRDDPSYKVVYAGPLSREVMLARLEPFDAVALLRDTDKALVFGEVDRVVEIDTSQRNQQPRYLRCSHNVYVWRRSVWWYQPIAGVAAWVLERYFYAGQILWIPRNCLRQRDFVAIFVAPRRPFLPCLYAKKLARIPPRIEATLW